jgi:uncharacterized protein
MAESVEAGVEIFEYGGLYPKLKTNLVVLQSTSFCNIDCRYCYLPLRSSKKSMVPDTLRAIAAKLYDFPGMAGEITILWHAGEPLILPPSYYDEAIEILLKTKPASVTLRFAIVTNGTLIDANWTEFFRRREIRVGISVDGPQFIHDSQRVNRSGKGTFNDTMRGISFLRSCGVKFYVISVLTRLSLSYPDEMFEFYASNGIKDVCFNVEEVEGPHLTSSLKFPGATDAFKEFLTNFIDRATKSDQIESIRELTNMIGRIGAIRTHPPGASAWNDQIVPFGMINIATDGSVSTFSPELLTLGPSGQEDFIIGNLVSDSVATILKSPKLMRMYSEIKEGVKKCETECAYFLTCGGGAPSNKFFENGSFDSTETMYCRLTQKALADVVLEMIGRFVPAGAAGGDVVEAVSGGE